MSAVSIIGDPVLAQGGGIDEMLFVLVPLLVFLTLQWLSRRKGAPSDRVSDGAEDIERRRNLTGGLSPPPGDRRELDDFDDGRTQTGEPV